MMTQLITTGKTFRVLQFCVNSGCAVSAVSYVTWLKLFYCCYVLIYILVHLFSSFPVVTL